MTAWRTLVSLQAEGVVRKIGVSNTYDVGTLEALEREGGRRPDVVQNRWFEGNRWNNDVWAYCVKHGIQYQCVHLSPSGFPSAPAGGDRKGTDG